MAGLIRGYLPPAGLSTRGCFRAFVPAFRQMCGTAGVTPTGKYKDATEAQEQTGCRRLEPSELFGLRVSIFVHFQLTAPHSRLVFFGTEAERNETGQIPWRNKPRLSAVK